MPIEHFYGPGWKRDRMANQMKEPEPVPPRISKVVHLSCQNGAQCELVPTHNSIGYGYIDDCGASIYFDSRHLQDHRWFDLQVGQEVEYTLDKSTPNYAATVVLINELASPRHRMVNESAGKQR